MNRNSFQVLRGHLFRELTAAALCALVLLQSVQAAAPGWWASQGVLNPQKTADDHAALNQGQLKNFVRAAIYELHAKLPGGAGSMLNQMLQTWRTQKLGADDHAVVTLGQLKAVAKPVYDSMQAAHLAVNVPWTEAATDDDDHAVANIGQAKRVFAFVVPDLVTLGMRDSDGDGFSDALEIAMGTNPFAAASLPGGVGDLAWMTGGSGGGNNGGNGGTGGGGGLPPYVDPYPEPWPDFDAAAEEEADKDTDNDGVPDVEDMVWYDPAIKEKRSGVPHYNIVDLGRCDGGFIDMADSGALLWQEDGYWPPLLKVWTPEHPTTKSITWNADDFGLEDGSSAWPPTAISNEGKLAGLADQLSAEGEPGTSKRRHYLYDPEAGSASWLAHAYPPEGTSQSADHHWGQLHPVFGPGGKLFGAVDYDIYEEDDDEITTVTGWTGFFQLSASSAILEDTALRADLPPLPEDPPDAEDEPPGTREKLEGRASFTTSYDSYYYGASGTGVVQVSERLVRDVYKQVFAGSWYSSAEDYWDYSYEDSGTPDYQPVYLEDVITYSLATAGGTKTLKTIDLVADDLEYSPWWFGNVAPAEVPWVVGIKYNWDDSTQDKAWIYKPGGENGSYQPCAIYAGRKQQQAGKAIQRIGLLTAQRQAIVYGDFEPETEEWETGLWADGEVQLIDKVIDGYGRYTDWQFRDVSRDGMLAATAVKGNEQRMLLLIPITTREIKEDGTLAEGGSGVRASMPSPVFCDHVDDDGRPQEKMSCKLNNLRVLANGNIVGDLEVKGEIASKACDNVKGDKGTITEAQLWVNGAETPQATFNVEPSKQSSGTRKRPYPYKGSFDTTITNVPLTGGYNVFKVTAQDPVYHMSGYSTWAVTIDVTEPEDDEDGDGGSGNPSGSFALSVQFPAATLAAGSADTVSVAVNLDGAAFVNVPLMETAAASGVFAGALTDGRPVRLSLVDASAVSTGNVDVLDATLLLGTPGGAATYRVGVRETGPASGVFTGGYVSASVAASSGSSTGGGSTTGSGTNNTGGSNGSGGATGGSDATSAVTISADPYEGMVEVEKSNGGEFHRYAIAVGAPEALKEHFKMAFGEGNDAVQFELMKDTTSGLMVLKDPNQPDKPFAPSFKPGETPLDESQAEHNKRMEDMKDVSFGKGFACGVGYAGLDMVTGTGKVIWGGMKFVGRGFLAVGLQVKFVGQWITGGDTTDTYNMLVEVGDKQWEAATQAYEMAKFLNGLLMAPQGMLPKMAWAFYNGGYEGLKDTALYGSESHRQLFQLVSEAIEETRKEWDHGTEGQRGYITGRIVGEVLSMIIPAGAAGKVLSKIEVLQRLRQTKLFQAATKALFAAKETALAINRFCFVAGTLVLTKTGLMRIEDIRPGMWAWSRDEQTEEMGWKRVVECFVTHPSVIHHLTYELRGQPKGGRQESGLLSPRAASETLGVTAPHPFWVSNREKPGFVMAEELRSGDELFTADGRQAVVTANVTEQAAGTSTFTTYNFEVEDYHTYFVGTSGVWVHNFSNKFCETMRLMLWHAQKRLGIPDWALPGNRWKVLKQGVLEANPTATNRLIDADNGNYFMHVTAREEIDDYARLVAEGRQAEADAVLANMASVTEQRLLRRQYFGGAGYYDIHHLAERWFSRLLGIPKARWNSCPGVPLVKRPGMQGFDAVQYQQKMGHAPIYHGGTLAQGSLKEALGVIYREFNDLAKLSQTGRLDDVQMRRMINKVKDLYESQPYSTLNLWPATRDWLIKEGVPPHLFIPPS